MREYFLTCNQKQYDNKTPLNRMSLCLFDTEDDSVEVELIGSMQMITNKGWISEKRIYEDFTPISFEDGGCLITEKDALRFIEKYNNPNAKLWVQKETQIDKCLIIANHINRNGGDPYDRS